MTFDPRTESNIATLHPRVQEAARKFMAAVTAAMATEGVTVKIISGLRTYEEQDALYAQGRTRRGRIVTRARGGYSNHNFGIAWDIGIFRGPVYFDESPLYRTAGIVGRGLGLEWGGDWVSMQDDPHFQLRPAWAKEMKERDMLAELRARVAAKRPIF